MKKSIILISALSLVGLMLVSCSSEPETTTTTTRQTTVTAPPPPIQTTTTHTRTGYWGGKVLIREGGFAKSSSFSFFKRKTIDL